MSIYISALGERIRRPQHQIAKRKESRIFLRNVPDNPNSEALRNLEDAFKSLNLTPEEIRIRKSSANQIPNLRYLNMEILAKAYVLQKELGYSREDMYNLLFNSEYIQILEQYRDSGEVGDNLGIIEAYQTLEQELQSRSRQSGRTGQGSDPEYAATLLRYLRVISPIPTDLETTQYQESTEIVG